MTSPTPAVRWRRRGLTSVALLALLGGAIDAYDAGVVNGNPNKHFSATVTALTAATEYRYRVGLSGS